MDDWVTGYARCMAFLLTSVSEASFNNPLDEIFAVKPDYQISSFLELEKETLPFVVGLHF